MGSTPSIASAVVDSLPGGVPYFLISPKSISFLRHSARCRDHFTNDLSIEETNKQDVVLTIERLRSTHSQVLLIPVDDSANRLVHATVDQLRSSLFPISDSGSFEMLNDKWQFYQRCSRLQIRVPKPVWLNRKSEIDFENLCAVIGLPFVIKPTNKSDGLGVRVIRSDEDLRKQILSCRKYDFSPLMAQSFIPGIDMDISALVDRGHIKNFAIQTRKADALYFVQNEELAKFARTIVQELSYTGVIHIDARLHATSGEIFLIEANPRFSGSLAEATSGGLNFVRAGICISMGLESPDPTTIFEVIVPSVGRILAEIATFKRRYSQLNPVERNRLRRTIRSRFREVLRLDS